MSHDRTRPATLVFTGDSITAADRDLADPKSLGHGFVRMIAEHLRVTSAAQCLNTGVGGNRIRDLVRRWRSDVAELAPDLLTILIGVNDVTRRYDTGDITSPEEFRTSYLKVLEAVPASTRIVLIEPFILPISPRQVRWREDLAEKLEVVRDLAVKFDTELIPADRVFVQAGAENGPRPWCPDGVHPSRAGHRLLADEWLRLGLWQ